MASITVQPDIAAGAHSDARDRARDRARGGLGGAAARPRRREGRRPGRGRRHAARAQPAADRRHGGDRRGRARRGADAVHRREGRHQARPEGRHRGRSAGRHHALRQEHAGRHRDASPWRTPARCCTRPTSTWTRSPSAPAIRKGIVDLDAPAEENILRLAKAKGVKPAEITAILLDRPRHADIIAAVRKTGAAVSLITDGDVAGVIHCAEPKTGIDIYLGIGGAPEGVLAAAALRCIGGQMQTRLVLDTEERRERALKMGIKDPKKKYEIEDMVRGDCLFAATGVTDRRHAAGREVRQGRDRDRDGGDALGHRHGAPGPRRAPAAREVSSGLRQARCDLRHGRTRFRPTEAQSCDACCGNWPGMLGCFGCCRRGASRGAGRPDALRAAQELVQHHHRRYVQQLEQGRSTAADVAARRGGILRQGRPARPWHDLRGEFDAGAAPNSPREMMKALRRRSMRAISTRRNCAT